MTSPSGPSRRQVLVAAAAAATAPLIAAAPAQAAGAARPRTWDLTLLGTSDTHGNVYNWDYYRDAEYDDSKQNDIGVAKLATLINQIRRERRGKATLVLDAGDTIQGTPLATYYAKQEPITATGEKHPMARAMNVIDYDAVTLGNHEFNYGLPLLDLWIRQLGFPALAANAVNAKTGKPAFLPYVIKKVSLGFAAPTLRVGILGLTNPGVAIWDKGNVEGKLRFDDMVATAAKWVPIMRARGADLVLISAHGGDSGTSSYGPELPNENPVALIAQQVPGIDAILFGHAHNEVVERFVTNERTGAQVLLSEPSKWGQRLTRMDFTLTRERGRWTITKKAASMLNTNTVVEDPKVLAAVRAQHQKTIAYVNQVVAQATVEMSTVESRYKDTPILDFINHVQAETVTKALAGTQYADLPVLSQASPFSRTAVFPAGDVKIRDVAGLYVFDNTLEAVVLSGAEVRTYLEYSAKYFRTLAPGAPVDPEQISDSPAVPDYNYDVISGLDYDIDISKPIGQRITRLVLAGTDTPVADNAQFVMAVNNYRRSGGGNFPGIVKTQVYNAQQEIRQLLIDWAQAKGTIDPADFFQQNWRLVREGVPVF
ncbi:MULTISPECIES: bifunctional UDP-sugar hydrolase/5'-nucleotidase [Micromonospora]|uniref:bifunctional metallophosphatase/5'-nucleotidase n=1 Tax=Micromonospora TaxID=1873 RepID=UPI00081FF07E|nr:MULTISPECIES: 5'-nucleotidase C-terminal domain-containing protein [Micromonospora]MBQ1040695.1 5'-nucleotidase C-terminal domain-containing protein [Micromonospora sp. C81]TQJ22718.1 2',3'-cyclic-nucleotide 2'-phosphodiesterase/3'-nucleotidase [Micromonospora sp. A202]WSK48851.1 5'-nucleotidase C-terminal domain-containing protein [Micromonospora zamorensis]WTE88436.1 5'-nucleotidase C-terminal domain-containing protein [Micromonospora zamorensis]SCG51566.1 2',3'-cyclic-nucleotide 2'-phosp